MKKCILSVFTLLSLALALPALATQPDVPPDGIAMKQTKLPVVFNHSTHNNEKCASCHHEVYGKAAYSTCSDSGCHNSMFRNDKSFTNYYSVIHSKSPAKYPTCLSCHMETAKKFPNKRKELIACMESKCHP